MGSTELQAFSTSLFCCKHTFPRNLATGSHSSAILSLRVDGPRCGRAGSATLLALPALPLTSDLTPEPMALLPLLEAVWEGAGRPLPTPSATQEA